MIDLAHGRIALRADLRGRGTGVPGSSLCSSGSHAESFAAWHPDERSVGLANNESAALVALERQQNERSEI